MSFDFSAAITQLAILALLLSLSLTLYRVKQRLYDNNKKRFGLVVAGNVICFSVLAAVLGKLSIETEVNEQLTLVTDGTQGSLTDPSALLLANPGLSSVEVQGYGLFLSQWQEFEGVKVSFEPPKVATGPIQISWPRQILLGNELVFEARWHSDSLKQIATVKLIDPAEAEVAQTRVKKGEYFTLKARPKALGNYSYRVKAEDDSGKILLDEYLPVSVTSAPVAKLMVLQSAPSFESRHLKNWAKEHNASLLILSTISRDRYLTQTVNLPGSAPVDFSLNSLNHYDILLVDGRALTNLSSIQLEMLQQAVSQGLGVMVLMDNDLAKSENWPELLKGFAVSEKSNILTVQTSFLGSDVLFDASPYELNAEKAVVFEADRKRKPLGFYAQKGLGKVAVSLMKDRYRWRLNGEREFYSQYWQKTLSQLARTRSDSRFLPPSSKEWVLPGTMSRVCVLSDNSKMKLFWFDEIVDLLQDRFNPQRYCAPYWPAKQGWQLFSLKDDEGKIVDRLHTYAFDSEQWQSARQHQRVADTKAFILASEQKHQSQRTPARVNQPIADIWYWLLLTIFASLLWWERKHWSEQNR